MKKCGLYTTGVQFLFERDSFEKMEDFWILLDQQRQTNDDDKGEGTSNAEEFVHSFIHPDGACERLITDTEQKSANDGGDERIELGNNDQGSEIEFL